MPGFSLDVTKWVQKAQGNIGAVIRKVAFDIGARIIMRTPVDTGRARGNWVLGIGTPRIHATDDVDAFKATANSSGRGNSSAKEALLEGLEQYTPGDGKSIFITNSVPYIGRLEYGSSKQAPAGMVRVTLTEFGGVVRNAVDDVQNGRGKL